MDLFKNLIGKKVLKIYIDGNFLRFETDQGDVHFTVEGDCCSSSYFHDFIGVEKLLNNGPVISAKEVDMEMSAEEKLDEKYGDDCISCYGYQFTTEDARFGEVTSVLSFRNASNGCYGGWMEEVSDSPATLPEIKTDFLNS